MKFLAMLVLYLINAPNGVPYFWVLHKDTSYHFFMGVIFALIALHRGKLKVNQQIYLISAYMVFIYLGQLLLFQGGHPFAFIRLFVLYVVFPYALVSFYRENLFKIYVDLIVILSAISLVLWIPTVFSPSLVWEYRAIVLKFGLDPISFDHMIFISTRLSSLGFLGLLRNSGPFSEGGSFATYLILTLVLNNYYNNNRPNLKAAIMIAAVITTFSTAGYVALLFYLAGTILKEQVLDPRVIMMIPLLLMFYSAYNEFDFLGSKIETHYTTQSQRELTEVTGGRFFGTRKSFHTLATYPITGKGILAATRETDYTSEFYAAYGFSVFGSKIGLLGFIFWLLWMYRATAYHSRFYRLKTSMNYLALMAVLFAQSVPVDSIPFLAYMFTGWFYKKYGIVPSGSLGGLFDSRSTTIANRNRISSLTG